MPIYFETLLEQILQLPLWLIHAENIETWNRINPINHEARRSNIKGLRPSSWD